MTRRKIDARLHRLEQQASRRRAQAEASSHPPSMTLKERREKILAILRETCPAEEVAALEALPAQEFVFGCLAMVYEWRAEQRGGANGVADRGG